MRNNQQGWEPLAVANYLLLKFASGKTPYGYGRLLKDIAGLGSSITPKGMICSELILEALVFGSGVFTEEYFSVLNTGNLFLPADFLSSDVFEVMPIEYLEVVD